MGVGDLRLHHWGIRHNEYFIPASCIKQDETYKESIVRYIEQHVESLTAVLILTVENSLMQRPHEVVRHVGDVMYRLFRQRVGIIIFIVVHSTFLHQG